MKCVSFKYFSTGLHGVATPVNNYLTEEKGTLVVSSARIILKLKHYKEQKSQ